MMKCKGQNEHETGMLEYLEDIIGTSRYKVRSTEYCVCATKLLPIGTTGKTRRKSRIACGKKNRKIKSCQFGAQ